MDNNFFDLLKALGSPGSIGSTAALAFSAINLARTFWIPTSRAEKTKQLGASLSNLKSWQELQPERREPYPWQAPQGVSNSWTISEVNKRSELLSDEVDKDFKALAGEKSGIWQNFRIILAAILLLLANILLFYAQNKNPGHSTEVDGMTKWGGACLLSGFILIGWWIVIYILDSRTKSKGVGHKTAGKSSKRSDQRDT